MPFQHIRASILPFGFDENKREYHFSLCIDLNPDHTVESARAEGPILTELYRKYPEWVKQLVDQSELLITYGSPAEIKRMPVTLLAPHFIDTLRTTWNLLPPKINKQRFAGNEPEPFSEPLNTNLNAIVPLFTGNIPDPQVELRKQMVLAFEDLISDEKSAALLSNYQMKVEELDGRADEFLQRLDAITSFAEANNQLQSKKLLQDFVIQKFFLSLDEAVDPLLETWAFFDSNIILQRITGKTIDFKIPEADFEIKLGTTTQFELQLSLKENAVLNVVEGINIEPLLTPVEWIPKQNLLLIEEFKQLSEKPSRLSAKNYDVGGKLIGLKAIRERQQNYLAQMKDPQLRESERYAIRRQLITLDTAALTLGINIYNEALAEQLQELASAPTDKNYLYRMTRGFRFAAASRPGEVPLSLGRRKVALKGTLGKNMQLPDVFQVQEFSAYTDTVSHALLDENGTINKRLIMDQAMLTWSGENIGMPSVFSLPENETNNEPTVDEGSVSTATKFVSDQLSYFFGEEYTLKGVRYVNNRRARSVSEQNTDSKELSIQLEYGFQKASQKKLVFGRNYRIVATPEYKNGWAVPFQQLSTIRQYQTHYLEVNNFPFKRNEPVKPVELYLQEALTDANNQPVKMRQGESLNTMVIRNQSPKDTDKENATTQRSVRHLLPPAISFQQAMWHNKVFSYEMDPEESYTWYRKYHFPRNEDEPYFEFNKDGVWQQVANRGPVTASEAFSGSTRMRPAYPKDCQTNYLPDPLVKGFRLEFFSDEARSVKAPRYLQYEELEFYFTGRYPIINSWKIILADQMFEVERLVEIASKNELLIRLPKGEEVFLRIRTILDEKYEAQLQTYGNYNEYTQFGNNDLLTPPLDIHLVHAMQRPLIRPMVYNILENRKELGKTHLHLTATIRLEQLGIYTEPSGINIYRDRTLPTGGLELYAKWEEYSDDPRKLVAEDDPWDPTKPLRAIDRRRFGGDEGNEGAAVFETAVELNEAQLENMRSTLNKMDDHYQSARNYAVDFKVAYDVRDTKYLEKWYWFKNQSKFTTYYPASWGMVPQGGVVGKEVLAKDAVASSNYFTKLSAEPFLVRVLNSKKPERPLLTERNMTLFSVQEDWQENSVHKRIVRHNRLRLYFQRGRLTSGKGERIGFVLNEEASPFNDYLVKHNLVSRMGRDIVSDSVKPYDGLYRNEGVLLNKSHFVLRDPQNLRHEADSTYAKDLEAFYPDYVEELGIMTFLPLFDKRLNCWYLDIELDLNDENGSELHSPFVQFALVHYQKWSHHYNKGLLNPNIDNECRISAVEKTGFVYIMGSRMIVLKQEGRVINPTLYFDPSTLKAGNATRFYAALRGRPSGSMLWQDIDFKELSNEPGTKNEGLSFPDNGKEYLLVILETETWNPQDFDHLSALINNKDSRVVLVSTFSF